MRSIDDDVLASVESAIRAGRLFRYADNGGEPSPARKLEILFAEQFGSKYCLAVNSCTSAIYLSLISAGVNAGDSVLIPAFTFIAVPSAIVQAGARPVLVEVDDNYVIDLDSLEASITPETRFLLLSYMRGRVPDMDAVLDLCQKHNITLLEDAAHSLGVKFGQTLTGKFGQAASFSFQSHKLMDAGEGGLLVTDDLGLAARALIYSGCYEENFRKDGFDDDLLAALSSLANSLPTFNFRMSNLSAAALLPQMGKIDERIARYNRQYDTIVQVLGESPHVRIPSYHPKVSPVCDSLQFYIETGVDKEKILSLKEVCDKFGLPVNLFGFDTYNARCFWNWKFIEGQELSSTRALLERTADIRLPLGCDDTQLLGLGKAIVAALGE